MNKKYKRHLTPQELAERPDTEIDYSDVPELDIDFWRNAKVVPPRSKSNVSLR